MNNEPIVVFALKDAMVLIAHTKRHKREAFEEGGLALFSVETDQELEEILAPLITQANGDWYLTEFMDRPFADLDEFMALRERIAASRRRDPNT